MKKCNLQIWPEENKFFEWGLLLEVKNTNQNFVKESKLYKDNRSKKDEEFGLQ